MTKLTIASRLIVALLGAVSAAACSGDSPAAPSPSSVIAGEQNAKASQAAPGVYDLSFNVFQNGTYQEVSSLPVKSQELILKAYVTDSSGYPAQKGTVTFEYCSYRAQRTISTVPTRHHWRRARREPHPGRGWPPCP